MKTNKEKILIILTACIVTVLVTFSIIYWDTIKYLFTQMTAGVEIVKDYVLSLGIVGFIAMSLIIIVCFFFPFISSVPLQLTSAVSYGLIPGIIHVWLSIFIASQLLFLFSKSSLFLSSKKKREEHRLMEEKIKNSNVNVIWFILLAYILPFVPFLVIHMVAVESGLKWWKYALITFLGPVPDIIITLWAGVKITTSSSPIISYVILVVILVIVVLSMIYKNKMIDLVFTPKDKKENGKENGN